MNKLHTLFLYTDGYKLGHMRQYPSTTETMYGYANARSTKFLPLNSIFKDDQDKVAIVGLHDAVSELHEAFDEFFASDIEQYSETFELLRKFINDDSESIKERFTALHKLGYLPLDIKTIPEGTVIPIQVPFYSAETTVKGFAWLYGLLEPAILSLSWKPITVATIAYHFRKLSKTYIEETSDLDGFDLFQFHDFGTRGYGGYGDGISTGLSHLSLFRGTENVGAVVEVNKRFTVDEDDLVAATIPATEHSVSCTNILTNAKKHGVDLSEAERMFFLDYITKTYPSGMVGYVADTFNYWDFIKNILTDDTVKKAIMDRDGKVVIRPDSFDDVVGGIIGSIYSQTEYRVDLPKREHQQMTRSFSLFGYSVDLNIRHDYTNPDYKFFSVNGVYYDYETYNRTGVLSLAKYEPSFEELGTVEALYRIFGGTVNSKGFIQLSEKISVIYGDGINYSRASDILSALKNKGFATDCIVMGLGGGTYQYISRDTLSITYKASSCYDSEVGNVALYKDPYGSTKKSLKGYLAVHIIDGKYVVEDNCETNEVSCLTQLSLNGTMLRTLNLSEIRKRLVDSM